MGAREVFGSQNKEYVFDLVTLSMNIADENTPIKGKPLISDKSPVGIRTSSKNNQSCWEKFGYDRGGEKQEPVRPAVANLSNLADHVKDPRPGKRPIQAQ